MKYVYNSTYNIKKHLTCWCINNCFQLCNNCALTWTISFIATFLEVNDLNTEQVLFTSFSRHFCFCFLTWLFMPPPKRPLGSMKLYFIWKTPLFFSLKCWRDFGVYVTWDCSSKHKLTQIPTCSFVKVTEKLRWRLNFALNTILTVGQLLQPQSTCSLLAFVFVSLLNEQ